ncbi:MAG: hypothetical protein ACM3VS_14895 [Candidatus Dadabacteria bacterium]
MVQTDVSQLSAECSDWLQILRNYRQEFHDYEKALEDTCKKTLGKQQLLEVEHLHNQFDIQLKNIHDVKQHIKHHERKIQFESSGTENIQEDTYAHHEQLLNEFLTLENTLQEIRNEFKNFVNTTSC